MIKYPPKKPLTVQRLRRFVAIRNKSGFSPNLQFSIDADSAGVDLDLLGKPVRFMFDAFTGYRWGTPYGTLVEYGRRLYFLEKRDIPVDQLATNLLVYIGDGGA